MIRINVYLTKKQVERLKEMAQNGINVSEHIRRAVDEYLAKFKDERSK